MCTCFQLQCKHIGLATSEVRTHVLDANGCHTCLFLCSDLLQNALIVPVKVLKGHGVVNKLGR